MQTDTMLQCVDSQTIVKLRPVWNSD